MGLRFERLCKCSETKISHNPSYSFCGEAAMQALGLRPRSILPAVVRDDKARSHPQLRIPLATFCLSSRSDLPAVRIPEDTGGRETRPARHMHKRGSRTGPSDTYGVFRCSRRCVLSVVLQGGRLAPHLFFEAKYKAKQLPHRPLSASRRDCSVDCSAGDGGLLDQSVSVSFVHGAEWEFIRDSSVHRRAARRANESRDATRCERACIFWAVALFLFLFPFLLSFFPTAPSSKQRFEQRGW